MSGEQHQRKIIRNLQKGDVFSFNEIYRQYNKKIYSFSLSYLKNREDAEGAVQEVFLNLWRKRADLKIQYEIGPYLFTITYNTIRKHFCKLSRERKHLEKYGKTVLTDDDSTNAGIEYRNMVELAEDAIGQLPARQQTIYHLSMRDGLTSKEIAEKLGISDRTVENHLYRAKSYLKKALSDNRLISLLFIWLYIR
ncbi:MAG: RNA polymerase sigma-70 factor [Bacteroidota bacterium]